MVPPLRYYPAYELIKRAAEEHAGPVLGPCRVPFHSIPFHSIPLHCIHCRRARGSRVLSNGRRRVDHAMRTPPRSAATSPRRPAIERSSSWRYGEARRAASESPRATASRRGVSTEVCRRRRCDGRVDEPPPRRQAVDDLRAARRHRRHIVAIHIYICIYITLRVARHAPCSIGNGGVLVMR